MVAAFAVHHCYLLFTQSERQSVKRRGLPPLLNCFRRQARHEKVDAGIKQTGLVCLYGKVRVESEMRLVLTLLNEGADISLFWGKEL